jgi:hypothetical protein
MACGTAAVGRQTANRRHRLGRCHSVLRLPSAVDDPVRIIRAAQIQLRRWRREVATGPAAPRHRRAREIVGEIIAARESLLSDTISVQTPQAGVDSTHAAEEAPIGAWRTGHGPCRERALAIGVGCGVGLIGGLDQLR